MIELSIHMLDTWIERNGWAGYDPYDIRGTRLFITLQKNKYTSFVSNMLLDRFPILSRKILRIRREVNAKAMALFARGYLNLYRKTGMKKYLSKALYCLNWLIKNPSRGYPGFCWGYPFDWQSRIFIPRGTPSSVATSFAAHAFLDAYEILRVKKYLEVAKSCCSFILSDLNIDVIDENRICFSYTPLDNFHIHNANLLSASVLLRTYRCTKNKKYKEMGIKAINFTVSHQNEDGSWYYWAPPNKVTHHIDNYHTGFILESLNIARRSLGKEFQYEENLRKGLKFYAEKLFVSYTIPKFTNKSIYPIDIHSCAQAIITFCELADFEPRYLYVAKNVARWTIENMQDKREGYFYYRIYRHYVDKTPYIRWGQAWMLRALSYLI